MKKLLSIIATTAILLNSVLAPVSVLAQEVTPTPEPTPEATATPEATPTPEETTTPTEIPTASPTETPVESSNPTPEATLAPEETTTPEPTIEATATPANNEVQNTSPQDQQISSPTTAPTTIATSTPTSTPEPKEDANVSVSVVTTNLFPETVQENSVVKLITDKLDYSPTEVAVITGSGFESGKAYSLTVSSSDDPATSTTSNITMDGSGNFTYNYQLDGNYRPNYSVEVKDGETVVATTSFTDTNVQTNTVTVSADWPNCNFQCTAGDVDITELWLASDTNGTRLSKSACSANTTVPVYIVGNFRNNSNSDRYAIDLLAKVSVGGTIIKDFYTNTPAGTCSIDALQGKQTLIGVVYGPFNWECGKSVEVQDIILSYDPPSGGNSCSSATLDCSARGTSKCWKTNSLYVSAPLITGFTAPPVCLGTATQYTDQTTGGVKDYHYSWDFTNNGSVDSSIANPSFTFPTAGNFTTRLTVTDSESPTPSTNYKDHTVTVWSNPTAGFDYSNTICPMGSINFTNTSTSGSSNGGVLSTYSWNFGDGNTSTEQNPSHIYSAPGNYHVTLTTTDNNSCLNTTSHDVTVSACNGTLTVIKNVINNNGGLKNADNFTISVTNGTPNSFAGSTTGTSVSVAAGSSFDVSEGDYYGYSTTMSGTCSGTMTAGAHVTCTVTNNDIQPKLTVTKIVDNTDGGDKTVSDFPLFVNTTGVTSGVQNGFDAGTYTVSETNQGNYRSVISGNCASDGSITLAVGDVKSCTITNTHYKSTPALSTLPNPTTALLGATIADTATLSGGFNPTGTMAFSLYDPDNTTCDLANRMWYEEVTVNGNGAYNTSNFSNTVKAGTWRWIASYSGDTNNNSISGGCSDELVTINKADTGVTTHVYNGEGQDITNSTDVLGANIHDSATVSGQVGVIGITGTITYNFYENYTCTGRPVSTETTTISGYPFTTSSSTKLNMGAGSYSYMATYSGDSNYNGSTGICEPFSIGKADSSVTTEVHNSDHQDVTNQTLNPGISVHDSATVLGTSQSFRPTGNVTYYFFTNGSCYGETTDSETVEVGSETEARLISEPGSYSYQANYEGDNNFNSSVGECEPFTVGSPSVSIAKTNNSGSGVHAGSTITYTLTISNTGSMNLDNLKISDVLPGGFSYVLGSTTGATTSDPTISGNILTWNIESLSAEQSMTISYQASTATNLSDGTYTNFATCRAYFGDEGSVECNDANSEISIGSTFGYSGNMAGQVLGASTMLPGTGSPTVLVIIGLGFLGTGIALNIASRKKYAKK